MRDCQRDGIRGTAVGLVDLTAAESIGRVLIWGTMCGQFFRPRERAPETTFRPDRAPASRTLYGRPAILRQERRSWTFLRANCKEKCKDPSHQFSEQTANGFASKADPMRPMNTIPLTTVGRRLVDR